jgi:hypothetical protein
VTIVTDTVRAMLPDQSESRREAIDWRAGEEESRSPIARMQKPSRLKFEIYSGDIGATLQLIVFYTPITFSE